MKVIFFQCKTVLDYFLNSYFAGLQLERELFKSQFKTVTGQGVALKMEQGVLTLTQEGCCSMQITLTVSGPFHPNFIWIY